MKNLKLLNSLLIVFLAGFYLMTFNSCELFEDDMPDPVEAEVGDTLWVHPRIEGDYFMSHSLARGTDGSIYYSVGGGTVFGTPSRVVAINEDDGSLLWQSPEMDHAGLSSRIVVGDDGTIYAIGYFTLYAINPSDGSFKWTWEVPETVPAENGGTIFTKGQIGSLALTGNGDLVLGSIGTGVYSRALYAISKTGSTQWYNLDAVGIGISGNISVANNVIYYYDDYHLKAVNENTGTVLWTKEIVSEGSSANNIVFNDNGDIIASFKEMGADQFKIHRVDPSTGNTLWSSTDESGIHGILLSPSDKLANVIGNLHLFDLNTGVARKFTEANLGMASAISNSNQYLISAQHNNLSGCSTYDEDGTFDWHVNLSGMVGQIVIDDNRVMYSIDNTGKIIATQGDAQLGKTGWPKLGHDNRNTSNWNK